MLNWLNFIFFKFTRNNYSLTINTVQLIIFSKHYNILNENITTKQNLIHQAPAKNPPIASYSNNLKLFEFQMPINYIRM